MFYFLYIAGDRFCLAEDNVWVQPRDVLKQWFRNHTNRPTEQTLATVVIFLFYHLSYWQSSGSGLVLRCICVFSVCDLLNHTFVDNWLLSVHFSHNGLQATVDFRFNCSIFSFLKRRQQHSIWMLICYWNNMWEIHYRSKVVVVF